MSTQMNCTNSNEIYSFHTQGANFLMGDGRVIFFRNTVNPALMAGMVSRDGGEVLGLEQ